MVSKVRDSKGDGDKGLATCDKGLATGDNDTKRRGDGRAWTRVPAFKTELAYNPTRNTTHGDHTSSKKGLTTHAASIMTTTMYHPTWRLRRYLRACNNNHTMHDPACHQMER